MNIDKILTESEVFNVYENKSLIRSTIYKIKKWTWDKAKKTLQGAFRYLVKFAKDKGIEKQVLNIINTMVGKQYRSLNALMKISLKENVLYENKWWDEAKGNFYGAASFYPLLQAFLELDKVIKDVGDADDMKYVTIDALIWASIVSGKVLSNRYKKKKVEKDIDDVGKAYRNMMDM
jgi:hypothetical protein